MEGADMTGKSLPVARAPLDILRHGFVSLEQQAAAPHPVAAMQRGRSKRDFESKMEAAAAIYGSAFAMRMRSEAAALSQIERLPGLPSSRAGLETVLGTDQDVDFEDYLGLPDSQPAEPKFAVHDAMEVKFGLI